MLLYGIVIISCMKLKETQFKPAPFRLKPQNIIVKGGLLPFLITVCLGIAQMGMGPFNTVYAKTVFGATNIGLMMSIGNLGAIFIAPQISRLTDKIDSAKMLLCSFLLFAVGPVLFSVAQSFAMCIVAACFQFIGFAVIASALQTLLVRNSPKELSSVAGNTFRRTESRLVFRASYSRSACYRVRLPHDVFAHTYPHCDSGGTDRYLRSLSQSGLVSIFRNIFYTPHSNK